MLPGVDCCSYEEGLGKMDLFYPEAVGTEEGPGGDVQMYER